MNRILFLTLAFAAQAVMAAPPFTPPGPPPQTPPAGAGAPPCVLPNGSINMQCQATPICTPTQPTANSFGQAVATADFDANGKSDIVVGAPGQVFVLDGNSVNCNSLLSPFPPLVSGFPGDAFGSAVATGLLVGGDSVPDIAVGAYLGEFHAGKVYVFNGANGSMVWSYAGTTPGDGPAGGWLGFSVAVGDVDGNGSNEVVAGEPNTGKIHILDGATGSPLANSPLVSPGYGIAVATGNVDTDAQAEIVAGVFGGQGSVRVIDYPGNTVQATLFGLNQNAFGDLFGERVAAGDVNGDGKADVVGGAPRGGPITGNGAWGYIRVFDVSTGTPISLFDALGAAALDHFGSWVAVSPDNTVIAGANQEGAGGPGYIHVYDSGGTLRVVHNGQAPGNFYGTAVAAGDVNGDGNQDVVVGAPGGGYVEVLDKP